MQIRLKKILNYIDEVVMELARTNKYKETFFLWDKAKPNIIKLTSRSNQELNEKQIIIEENKFDVFEEKLKQKLGKICEKNIINIQQ